MTREQIETTLRVASNEIWNKFDATANPLRDVYFAIEAPAAKALRDQLAPLEAARDAALQEVTRVYRDALGNLLTCKQCSDCKCKRAS